MDAHRQSGLFAAPSGPASELTLPPRLASWMRKDHPDQIRLGAYLDSLNPLVLPVLEAEVSTLALELRVGLSGAQGLLTGGRDLDNFLSPIVHRFGPRRFVAAIGHKAQSSTSTLCVGPARPASAVLVAGWHYAVISATADDMSLAWKEEVASALPVETQELPPGPVEMHVSFRGARQKLMKGNWHEYWKPTIDALGRILGEENPIRPYNPRDDRITSLGFHRVIEGSGKPMRIHLWWRSATLPVAAPAIGVASR